MTIIYKAGPDLFIVDWLFRQNHSKHKDAEILGMQLNINAILTTTNIPECMMMHELQQMTSQDNRCSVSRNISHKAGLNTKIKYNKTSDHTEHLRMT